MKDFQPHQLVEEQSPPETELEEEDMIVLLERSYLALQTVLERKLPKALHTEVHVLVNDIESALKWYQLH